jgi:PAS domain S-box-containing protein
MTIGKATPVDARSLAFPLNLTSHEVQFYERDPALIEDLARVVGTSLVSGGVAMVVATKPHRDALAHELNARALNLSKIAAQGRFLVWDAAETLSKFIVGDMPDPEKFSQLIVTALEKLKAAATVANPSTVIFGEMVALLFAEGKQEAAIRLEQLWNDLATKHSFTLRCAYPMNAFQKNANSEAFARVCAEHSNVVPVGTHRLLLDDDERMRTIAELQQKLEVLEYERALRASELRFRLLVEAVRDYAIFMLDPEGHIASWNTGAERLKGYKASEIIGKHFSQFYPDEDLKNFKPQRELEIAEKEGRVEDEGWRLRKDGSRFWANVVITALRDPDGKLVGFLKVTRDFTDRMQAEQALLDSKRRLQDSEKSLRNLSLHLLRTQDEERRRIGRDLHDSLGQYLSVLKMKLEGIRKASSQEHTGNLDELAACAQLAEDSVKEVRTISYLLYPPMLEEMGLNFAIPWYLEGFTKRSGIKTTFEISPHFGRLSAEVELVFFRVLQESLTNVHRHSGSETASVRLSISEDSAVLEIIDQGKGMESRDFEDPGHDWTGALGVGLRGMNERLQQVGGKLEVFSSKDGTTISASVPMGTSTAAATAG